MIGRSRVWLTLAAAVLSGVTIASCGDSIDEAPDATTSTVAVHS